MSVVLVAEQPEAAFDSAAVIEALVRRLQMAEVRFGVLAVQLPRFGLDESALGCAREAQAIRQLLRTVRA